MLVVVVVVVCVGIGLIIIALAVHTLRLITSIYLMAGNFWPLFNYYIQKMAIEKQISRSIQTRT